jgi:hypothetical protein
MRFGKKGAFDDIQRLKIRGMHLQIGLKIPDIIVILLLRWIQDYNSSFIFLQAKKHIESFEKQLHGTNLRFHKPFSLARIDFSFIDCDANQGDIRIHSNKSGKVDKKFVSAVLIPADKTTMAFTNIRCLYLIIPGQAVSLFKL